MQNPFRHKARLALASAVLVLLAACGGGGSESSRDLITRVVVAGDSLADVGTFGYKFTVQNSASRAAGFPVFPQLVAQDYGIDRQCNYYVYTGTGFTPNSTSGCTNYAIGDGRIVNLASQGGAAGPQSIPLQLATAAKLAGSWRRTDLIIVNGGGNDAGDLVLAYLGAAGGATGMAAYQTFLGQLVDAQTLAATLAQPNGPVLAAALYMHAAADAFYASIQASLLEKGAAHVVVLNMPDITLTPYFQAVMAAVAQANGGGQAGTAAAQALQDAVRLWIGAFNTELKDRIGDDDRVVLVDFYAVLNEEVRNPAAHGLTNATTPACPATGVDEQGLPDYDVRTCTSAGLNAAPPPGASAGWWQSWLFSTDYHPTPYGHRLLADAVERALREAGWL